MRLPVRGRQEGHKQNGDVTMVAETVVMHFEDRGNIQEPRNVGKAWDRFSPRASGRNQSRGYLDF